MWVIHKKNSWWKKSYSKRVPTMWRKTIFIIRNLKLDDFSLSMRNLHTLTITAQVLRTQKAFLRILSQLVLKVSHYHSCDRPSSLLSRTLSVQFSAFRKILALSFDRRFPSCLDVKSSCIRKKNMAKVAKVTISSGLSWTMRWVVEVNAFSWTFVTDP